MGSYKLPVVIDAGSDSTRAGFAGENVPRAIFPTWVGSPIHPGLTTQMGLRNVYVGEEAYCKRGILSLSSPIDGGIPNNWDHMEYLWLHTFHNELHVAPEEHSVLLTLPPLAPRLCQAKMAEIMFETLHTSGLYIGMQAVLSLYASGRTTGLVVDSGDTISHVVPIYEGWAETNDIARFNLGGRDMTDYLSQMLRQKGHFFTNISERKVVRDMKEKLTFVALDFQKKVAEYGCSSNGDKEYKLPDGQLVSVGSEMCRCPEPMFQPKLFGMDSPGIHQIIQSAIMNSDLDIQRDLFRNIVLSGGNTMFPGIEQRLFNGIRPTTPPAFLIKIDAPKNRHYSSWLGGVCLASLSMFDSICITKVEYDDTGPSIMQRKMFY